MTQSVSRPEKAAMQMEIGWWHFFGLNLCKESNRSNFGRIQLFKRLRCSDNVIKYIFTNKPSVLDVESLFIASVQLLSGPPASRLQQSDTLATGIYDR